MLRPFSAPLAMDDTLAKLFDANEQWSEAVKIADPRHPRYRSTSSSSISLPIFVRFSGLDDQNFGLPCPQKRHHCLAPRLHLRPSYRRPYLSAFCESGWIYAPAWHVTRDAARASCRRPNALPWTATISGKENERSAGTIKVVFAKELTKPKCGERAISSTFSLPLSSISPCAFLNLSSYLRLQRIYACCNSYANWHQVVREVVIINDMLLYAGLNASSF